MRQVLFLLCLLLAFPTIAQETNFWAEANEATIALPANSERTNIPQQYHTLQLNIDEVRSYLQNAPMERTAAARNNPLLIDLPMPNGEMETFQVYESPVMQPGLAARFPTIKSYAGHSLNNASTYVRFVASEFGFNAIFHTANGIALIAPYAEQQADYYISYYHRHQAIDDTHFVCGVNNDDIFLTEHLPLEGLDFEEASHRDHAHARSTSSEVVELREYKMALACTAEWAALQGGTFEAAMNSMNTVVNLLNGVYEPEMAFRFTLIDNNDLLVFTDAATDPYVNVNNGAGLLNQNQQALNSIIGADNYDIGHVMTITCTDVGGIAGGTVCSSNKGRGVTCQYANLQNVVLNVATHEVGHQFSASHTWDNCPGILDQRSGSTAFEPGSGSTILSYSGSCGTQNVISGGDIYFHVGSLQQMYDYSHFALGETCADITPTDNNTPDLELPYDNGFYIPISTPFELTAVASDPDGDELTYCWEQYNTGPISELGNPIGTAPSFRSYPPVSTPTRIFPRIQSVVSNISQQVEVLPTYSRNLKFRCTVRDNNQDYGGVVWEEVSFEATEEAGPFRVAYPNNLETWHVGDYQEVLWEVANTDAAPVNCQKVNIKLSLDGGYTYPLTLAENVPNDGAHFVTVPDEITSAARVRVEAAESIFFDISNINFQIVSPTEPGFALSVSPYDQQICTPDPVIIELNTLSLLDYDSLVTFEVSGLPANANAVFSANPVLPSEGETLTIETDNVTEPGVFDISISAYANESDTLVREAVFELVISDFSAFAPTEPANGSSGISELPSFTWTSSPFAESYDIEIATSPAFGSSVVETATGITVSTYTPSVLLEKNELYFWRVRPSNACGKGDFSTIQAFHTEVSSCFSEVNDITSGISAQGSTRSGIYDGDCQRRRD